MSHLCEQYTQKKLTSGCVSVPPADNAGKLHIKQYLIIATKKPNFYQNTNLDISNEIESFVLLTIQDIGLKIMFIFIRKKKKYFFKKKK